MRNCLLISALASLLLFAGCHKQPQAAPPPQAQAPAPQPPQQPSNPTPAPASTLKLKMKKPHPETQTPAGAKPAEPVHHKRLKPSPATPETTQETPAPKQTASVHPHSAASAIGQLSEGDAAASPDLRKQTVDLISSVEHKLKDISRPLSEQEQKTTAQVRKFLQDATEALHNQDVDAAHTLATKADVLLEELLK